MDPDRGEHEEPPAPSAESAEQAAPVHPCDHAEPARPPHADADPAARTHPRRPVWQWLALWAIFAGLAAIVHGPLFRAQAIQDDVEQLYSRPVAPSLSDPGGWLFAPYLPNRAPGAFNHYRPVQRLVEVVERAVFADSYRLMHAGAALWSALVGLCVFFLVRRALSSRSELPPLLAATFFLVHPLHVEVMAQMVNRGEMLVAAAAVGCCLLHTRPGRTLAQLATCALLALLALLSKEHAVVFIALVAAYSVGVAWQESSLREALLRTLRDWKAYTIYPLAVAGSVALHVGALGDFLLVGGKGLSGWSLAYRAHVATIVTGSYARKMVHPTPLSLDYSGLLREAPSEQIGLLVVSALALIAFLALACWPGRERPARALGAAWFCVAISPVSHVVPCTTVLADRNGYLASMGAALALAGLFAELNTGSARRRRVLAGGVGLALLVLAAGSFQRSRTWETPLRLWTDAATKNPLSAGAKRNLGAALWNHGQIDAAERVFRELIELKPDYVEAHVLHAKCLHRLGQRAESKAALRRIAQAYPDDPLPPRELGRLLLIEGDRDGGVAVWREVVERFPADLTTAVFLAEYLSRQGRSAEAAAVAQRALLAHPDDPRLLRFTGP